MEESTCIFLWVRSVHEDKNTLAHQKVHIQFFDTHTYTHVSCMRNIHTCLPRPTPALVPTERKITRRREKNKKTSRYKQLSQIYRAVRQSVPRRGDR